MNHIRSEFSQNLLETFKTTIKEWIEAKILMYGHRHPATREVDAKLGFDRSCRRSAGSHNEQWYPFPLGVSSPFTAGSGRAVHLIECVGKQCDSRTILHAIRSVGMQRYKRLTSSLRLCKFG